MAQNLKKGIAKVGYAPITVSGAGEYTYGNVKWLKSDEAGGREYTAEPNGENTEIYADSISVYSAEENNGYDITLVLLAVIDDIEKDWLNNSELATGGYVEIASTVRYPKDRPKQARQVRVALKLSFPNIPYQHVRDRLTGGFVRYCRSQHSLKQCPKLR